MQQIPLTFFLGVILEKRHQYIFFSSIQIIFTGHTGPRIPYDNS